MQAPVGECCLPVNVLSSGLVCTTHCKPVKFVFKLKPDLVSVNLLFFCQPHVRNAANDRSRGLGHKKGPQKRVPEQILSL